MYIGRMLLKIVVQKQQEGDRKKGPVGSDDRIVKTVLLY
jgi:hypothetical protein